MHKFLLVPSILIFVFILVVENVFGQGVGISEASITPDASSILELRSTARGFLVPRMTTGERDGIALPVTGLLIYNTTLSAFQYYNGGWSSLNSGAVTAVTASAPLASSGGTTPDISISGTIGIANGGTNSSTALTNNKIMVSSAGAIVEAGAMTNGQLLVGSTGAAPVIANLTGTANQISVTNAAGSITLATPQDVHAAATPTFGGITLSTTPLGVSSGGTGLSSGTSGGVLGFTASGTIASSVALTASALVIGGGAGATPTALALGTANQMLGMNSGATAHEYKTLNGTANQISVTNAAGSITLAAPQDIHAAATPTFAGLTLNGIITTYNSIATTDYGVPAIIYSTALTGQTAAIADITITSTAGTYEVFWEYHPTATSNKTLTFKLTFSDGTITTVSSPANALNTANTGYSGSFLAPLTTGSLTWSTALSGVGPTYNIYVAAKRIK